MTSELSDGRLIVVKYINDIVHVEIDDISGTLCCREMKVTVTVNRANVGFTKKINIADCARPALRRMAEHMYTAKCAKNA